MKSILTLEITHQKPLPGTDNLSDICANRIYSLIYARGVEVGIVAKLESASKTVPNEDITNFIDALNGGKGDLDAWLECNDEQEIREIINELMKLTKGVENV